MAIRANEPHKWMQEAFANAKGQLRKKAGVKKGQKIPAERLEQLAHSKDLKTKRQAVLARTARQFH